MDKNTIQYQIFKSSVGELKIASYNNEIVLCDWLYRKMRSSIDARIEKQLGVSTWEEKETAINQECKTQITEYLNGERETFSVPIKLVGTEFQQEVWQALLKIPFGKTLSYQTLSNQMQQPKAIRAIASANGANGISIIVPCHRIIGSNGDLVGYAGGLPAKKKLLQLEKSRMQLELF